MPVKEPVRRMTSSDLFPKNRICRRRALNLNGGLNIIATAFRRKRNILPISLSRPRNSDPIILVKVNISAYYTSAVGISAFIYPSVEKKLSDRLKIVREGNV